jgi:hypothetical protein
MSGLCTNKSDSVLAISLLELGRPGVPPEVSGVHPQERVALAIAVRQEHSEPGPGSAKAAARTVDPGLGLDYWDPAGMGFVVA